jgi:hypothetical protein
VLLSNVESFVYFRDARDFRKLASIDQSFHAVAALAGCLIVKKVSGLYQAFHLSRRLFQMFSESLLDFVIFCGLGEFRESFYKLIFCTKVSKFFEHGLA